MWDTHDDFDSCAGLSQIGFKVELVSDDFRGCNLSDRSEETEATATAVAAIRGRWRIPDMEPIIDKQYHKNLSYQYQTIFIQPNTDINHVNSMITQDAKDYNDTNPCTKSKELRIWRWPGRPQTQLSLTPTQNQKELWIWRWPKKPKTTMIRTLPQIHKGRWFWRWHGWPNTTTNPIPTQNTQNKKELWTWRRPKKVKATMTPISVQNHNALWIWTWPRRLK